MLPSDMNWLNIKNTTTMIKHFSFPKLQTCSCVSSLPLRWVFKQLYDKGLVYRGVKVMPFSTACNTPLSNFESHQNYKVHCRPACSTAHTHPQPRNCQFIDVAQQIRKGTTQIFLQIPSQGSQGLCLWKMDVFCRIDEESGRYQLW